MTFDRKSQLYRFSNSVHFHLEYWVQDNKGFPLGVGNRISFVLSFLKSHLRDLNHISDAVILLIVAETYRRADFCDEQVLSSILDCDGFMQRANDKIDTQLRRDTTFTRCGFSCPFHSAPAHDHWEYSLKRALRKQDPGTMPPFLKVSRVDVASLPPFLKPDEQILIN